MDLLTLLLFACGFVAQLAWVLAFDGGTGRLDGAILFSIVMVAIMAARILALKYPVIDEELMKLTERERERYDQTADEALARFQDKSTSRG